MFNKYDSFDGAVVCVLFEELFMTPTEKCRTTQTYFTSGILNAYFPLGCNLHFSRGVLANFLSDRNIAMKL